MKIVFFWDDEWESKYSLSSADLIQTETDMWGKSPKQKRFVVNSNSDSNPKCNIAIPTEIKN